MGDKISGFELNQLADVMRQKMETAETPEELQACMDTLESIQCMQEDKLVAIAQVMRNFAVEIAEREARAKAMQEQVDAVKRRTEALEKKSERLQQLAESIMHNMDTKKLEVDGVKMSLRKYGGGSVNITDIDLIPKQFIYYTEPQQKVDKTALKEHMKANGGTVPGAELVEAREQFKYEF